MYSELWQYQVVLEEGFAGDQIRAHVLTDPSQINIAVGPGA